MGACRAVFSYMLSISQHVLVNQNAEHSFCHHHPLRRVHPARVSIPSAAPIAAVEPLVKDPHASHRRSMGRRNHPIPDVVGSSYVAAVHCGCHLWSRLLLGLVRAVGEWPERSGAVTRKLCGSASLLTIRGFLLVYCTLHDCLFTIAIPTNAPQSLTINASSLLYFSAHPLIPPSR